MIVLPRWREDRLLKRIRAGDREAANELVDKHHESVFRWLVHLCKDRELAADLTQETFVQVWRKLDAFRGQASLRTWIHQIAYRAYLHSRRAPRPDTVPLSELTEEAARTETDLTALAVDDALTGLPEAHREAVVLHYLQGLTCAEVAEVLDVPLGTILSRLHTARRRLLQLLSDDPEPTRAEVQAHATAD